MRVARSPSKVGTVGRATPWGTAWGLGTLLALSALSCSLFNERNLDREVVSIGWHIPHTMAESLALLNGRTPGADFFPLYQYLMGYPVALAYHVFGVSILTYTATMAGLSFVALGAVFVGLLELARRPVTALGLFVLWLALGFYPIQYRDGSVYNAFTYFALYPIRFLGPLILWSALVRLRLRLTRRGMFFAGLWALLTALNNPEFGLPAAGIAIAGLWFFPETQARRAFIGGGLSGLTACVAFIFLRTGSFLHGSEIVSYLLAFGQLGYNFVGTPLRGFDLLMMFTSVACVVSAVTQTPTEPLPRARQVALFFMGLFGIAIAPYYLNRSHHEVLQGLFSVWGLQVCALSLDFLENRKKGAAFAAPRVWIFVALAFMAMLVPSLPNPWTQWNRLQAPGGTSLGISALADEVRSFTVPGEKVALVHPWGFWVAHEASVENLSPFSQAGSIFLKSQVAHFFRVLETNKVRLVWGEWPEFFRRALAAHGYTQIAPRAWQRAYDSARSSFGVSEKRSFKIVNP